MVVSLYNTYTQIPHNVRPPHQRIVTFSTHRDLFDYCTLLMFLVDQYLWEFYGKTRANHVVLTVIFIRRPRMLQRYSIKSLRSKDITELTAELKSSSIVQYRNKIYYFVGGFVGHGYRFRPKYTNSNRPYEDYWT